MNLGNMIEASLKQIVQDRENENAVDADEIDDEFEEELFDYKENTELADADYSAYYDRIENEKAADAALMAQEVK